MELEQPCQLFSKEGFTFSKQTKNHYTLSFYMENKQYVLSKLIDFHLVKLIYDLNNDIYEDIHFNIIDDQHATIALLMKPLFEDLGMPQRFSNLYITKVIHQSGSVLTSGIHGGRRNIIHTICFPTSRHSRRSNTHATCWSNLSILM